MRWDFAKNQKGDAEIHRQMNDRKSTGGGASDPAAIGHHGHAKQFRDVLESIKKNVHPAVDGRKADDRSKSFWASTNPPKPADRSNCRCRAIRCLRHVRSRPSKRRQDKESGRQGDSGASISLSPPLRVSVFPSFQVGLSLGQRSVPKWPPNGFSGGRSNGVVWQRGRQFLTYLAVRIFICVVQAMPMELCQRLAARPGLVVDQRGANPRPGRRRESEARVSGVDGERATAASLAYVGAPVPADHGDCPCSAQSP